MDVQCTDGYSMLLQYVSSYITKMHDDFIFDDLYNVDIDARNAVYRYVMGTPPTEPEMWLSLSDMKFVHHSGKTKRFTVPRFVDVLSNRWTQQYMKRSPDKHHLVCCSCIVFALRQPRTVTCTRKTSKRAWRAKWCRLGTLNFSGNTLSLTCPFAHTKIYCLPISSKCQICCSTTLLLCMPTLSCGLATTPSSKCCTGVPSKHTRLQHTCLLFKHCTTPTTVGQRNFC